MSAPQVCIVGGAGHVGAPLGLVLASTGMPVVLYDINAAVLASIKSGKMPFLEVGGDQLLGEVLARGLIEVSSDPASVRGVPFLVITIGTPIDEFHNPRLNAITDAVDRLLPYLGDDQTIILRSTVYPGVTESLERHIRSKGRRSLVAFCPERVVQGRAIEELRTLPQIVSGTTPEAEDRAAQLFARIAPRIVRMRPKEAEFAKLINNAYRYITFAAANEFYMLVEEAGLDYDRVLSGLRDDYPRARDLPGPGFAAGPCLMKDTMQLVAFDNTRFLLGSTAVTVNEGLPRFLVDRLRQRRDLTKTTVGILGMAFKADVDDIRESLSYKLGKILRFHGARVLYSDEFAKDPTFIPAHELVERSDVVIVGVPHTAYRSLEIPASVETVDLWHVLPRRTGAT
jgi:UDP-N-acetyl-D-mannosaminuronic acid dehydrogenase